MIFSQRYDRTLRNGASTLELLINAWKKHAIEGMLGAFSGKAETRFHLGQKHDAVVGRHPSAIKGGGNPFETNGWKFRSRNGIGADNQILFHIKHLCYINQPESADK